MARRLRSALDYCARTAAERIEIAQLSCRPHTHELAEERELRRQVLAFFVSVRQRSGRASEFAGSFASSWTADPRDIEAAVPIN